MVRSQAVIAQTFFNREMHYGRIVLTLAMPAAVATTTVADRLSPLDEDVWVLYSSARDVCAFDTAAAEAATSALCLTASRAEASRFHLRVIGPSDAAEVPSLQAWYTS